VLAIQHGTIPPTINLENQDPECDLDCVPLRPRNADIRLVLSNAFGFGGHDVALAFRKVGANGATQLGDPWA
jgi:3-oxoacyl-[acyl-carrier-protein] synthase II